MGQVRPDGKIRFRVARPKVFSWDGTRGNRVAIAGLVRVKCGSGTAVDLDGASPIQSLLFVRGTPPYSAPFSSYFSVLLLQVICIHLAKPSFILNKTLPGLVPERHTPHCCTPLLHFFRRHLPHVQGDRVVPAAGDECATWPTSPIPNESVWTMTPVRSASFDAVD